MIQTLKFARPLLLAGALIFAGLISVPQAHAGTAAVQQGTHQTKRPSATPVAGKLKTPGKRLKVQCNGKTTSECCSGIDYCGCLYAPGSDNNHPTACHSSPPS